jgi:hypothetical protein
VDVPVVIDALEHLLHAAHVLLVGGADEEVVGGIELRREGLEALGVAVGQLLGLEPLGAGRVGDRLTVLVGAGEKEDVLAALAHVARQDVGGHRRVGVPEVGLGVHVVDRGRDVVGHSALTALPRDR